MRYVIDPPVHSCPSHSDAVSIYVAAMLSFMNWIPSHPPFSGYGTNIGKYCDLPT